LALELALELERERLKFLAVTGVHKKGVLPTVRQVGLLVERSAVRELAGLLELLAVELRQECQQVLWL
jgi:hypothetical protein